MSIREFEHPSCHTCGFPRGSFRIDDNCAESLVVEVVLVVDIDKDLAEGSAGVIQSSNTNQLGNILTALANIVATPAGTTITPV